MHRRSLLPMLPLLAALGCFLPKLGADEVQGLSTADFEKLHRELHSHKEAWETIPWRLSLLEARAQAAAEKKPIYLLVRSGHPLACV